jgi:Methyltransferase domain
VSWHVVARQAAQRVGIQPRYLRRLRWISKARAVRSVGAPLSRHLGYVLADPEPDNFTYELANWDELEAFVADVCGADRATVAELIAEARTDQLLARRLRDATASHRLWSKREPPLGKRLAWYALARLVRPELIVETGVHDGLGALVLLRALERNAQEGTAGRLVSFDINPAAGWIVGSDPRWELRIEPALEGLPARLEAGPAVGIFIHDSLHTYENERAELLLAGAHLAPDGVLITDNAHGSPALRDSCEELGLRYFEFHERPAGHFYPGGAMGAGRANASS